MTKMNHIQTLLFNRVRESLEKLSSEGVGFIDWEESGKIGYFIDGRSFHINVLEGIRPERGEEE